MPTPTTDFSIFDVQELISYEPTSDPPVAAVPAVRRPLTQSSHRNIERYVELEPTDVVFHLDGGPLVSTTLASGDTLIDSNGRIHLVLFVERQTFNNTIAAVCRPSA